MTIEEFETLLASGETSWLDWKAEFPSGLLKGKSDPKYDEGRGSLLKDLVSIANGGSEQYGYLVYGVKDKGATRIVRGNPKSFDDADFQTWAKNTFNPIPKFAYSELSWSDTETIGVFTIERVPEYPHVVIRSLGGVLFEGQVWFRQGTQNRIAHRAELQSMIMGETPFVISRTDDPELLRAFKCYDSQWSWSRFTDKDSNLVRGYRIAYYPGTRREVWVMRHHGQPQHIAMLKPRTQI